eukprot:TRINITY_DN120_c0_g1_i10.p1 TRINITY_DN120_c0_g1~~TRINITY_DN120_c0_g1_i10.p1  ORF type:complete len:275 (-),score=62.00 TRINITY_DN120_c0_g1_i10:150-974(-)
MIDVELNNSALVDIARQVAEGRDNNATLTLTPIPVGPNAAAIQPLLLQNQPGYPPKPAGMNVATYEIILRIQEGKKLLASHDLAYQQQSLLKLRESLLALPTKLSVKYDPSNSGVLAAFENLSGVIFSLEEVLKAIAKRGMTPEYEKERTDEITKEFLDALRKCAIAVKKAHEVYKARFVGGIVTGVAGTVGAIAAAVGTAAAATGTAAAATATAAAATATAAAATGAVVATPIVLPIVAVTSGLIAIGGFIFAAISGNAKSQTEKISKGLENA